jgi:CHAD domain-containing protein
MRYRRETEAGVPGGRGGKPRPTVAHIWTVKLPSEIEGATLSRTEVNWDADDGPDGAEEARALPPLPDAAQSVAGITLGEPLAPIANLVTTRQRSQLRTSDGRVLAEIAHDTVTGTNLLPLPDGTEERPAVCFTEVEVELAEGSALEVLDAVAARLVAAGARHSRRKSKLMTVLDPSSVTSGEPEPAEVEPQGQPSPRHRLTMADVLQQQARACLDALTEHDPPIRLGDPDVEHVHRSRVATRRFRSVMRAFGPLFEAGPVAGPRGHGADLGADGADGADLGADLGADDAELEADEAEVWFAGLTGELRWLGQALGRARDADVRMISLERECDRLGPADAEGAEGVLRAASDDKEQAHRELLEAMTAPRYSACLRSLEALIGAPAITKRAALDLGETAGTGVSLHGAGAAPGASSAATATTAVPEQLWQRLAPDAANAMPELGRRQWRKLRKAVQRLGDHPSDESLHRVRIQAKRLRYIAEAATPVLRPAGARQAAGRTVKLATALQDILGEVHDAAVNEQWLRHVASRSSPVNVTTALAAGQLIGRGQEVERANRQSWRAAWERLEPKKVLKWTKSAHA